MCNTCALHKEERRDQSIHDASSSGKATNVNRLQNYESKVGLAVELKLKAEDVPPEFPFLKMAIAAAENGTLLSSDE